MKLTLVKKVSKVWVLGGMVLAGGLVPAVRGQAPPTLRMTPKAVETTNSAFPDKKDRLSYAVGMNMGSWLKRNQYDLNMDLFTSALKAAMAGEPTKMSDAEAMHEMQGHSQELMAKRREEQRQQAEKNRKTAEAWLAANKEKPGIKTETVELPGPGGKTAELQYKVITEGTGPVPKTNDQVVVNYRATTIDGKEVDNSNKRPGAGKFTLGASPHFGAPVAGVMDAVRKMSVGSKWEIYLPPSLAFGDNGGPGGIEPGSALIYEVELVSIDTPQPLTSDIIRVPSADELKKGAKVEVLKPEDVARLTQSTNGAPPNNK